MLKKEGKNKKEKKVKITNDHRVPTGIQGFDELIQGGFPKNSSILICGGPGTGKTIFCLQYLLNGVKKFNEKGLYVTFEQRTEALHEQGKQFGWDLSGLEKSGKLKILSIPVDKITKKTIKEITEMVKKEDIKRLVIDSLSTLAINAPIYTTPSELAIEDVAGDNVVFSPPIIGDYIVKRFVYGFIDELRNLDCTTLLISEASQSEEYISRDTLSEFVCDGVVLLKLQETLNMRRLQIMKLRKTAHPFKNYEFNISTKGINLESENEK